MAPWPLLPHSHPRNPEPSGDPASQSGASCGPGRLVQRGRARLRVQMLLEMVAQPTWVRGRLVKAGTAEPARLPLHDGWQHARDVAVEGFPWWAPRLR